MTKREWARIFLEALEERLEVPTEVFSNLLGDLDEGTDLTERIDADDVHAIKHIVASLREALLGARLLQKKWSTPKSEKRDELQGACRDGRSAEED